MIGAMGLVFPQVLGVGYGAIDLALMVKLSWWFMALLVLFKILATAITIGSGVRIGSNAVVVRDVPQNSTVVGVPGRLIERKKEPADTEHRENQEAAEQKH